MPNPIGDAAHHPLTEADVIDLLGRWLDDAAAVSVVRYVAGGLADAPDVAPLLQRLAG